MNRLVFLTQGLNWQCTFPSGLLHHVFRSGSKLLLVKLTWSAKFVTAKVLTTLGGSFTRADRTQLGRQIRRWLGIDDPNLARFHILAAKDEWLKPIAIRHRACPLVGLSDFYFALVWTIIGQQISMAAARAILARFVELYGQKIIYQGRVHRAFPSVELVANLAVENLSAAKISRPKARAILQISRLMCERKFDYRYLEKLTDLDQLVGRLTALPGIGPWSANYLAMLYFRHPDALPAQDAGLIKAVKLLSQDKAVDDLVWKAKLAQWKGLRSYAVYFLWKYLT